MERLEEFYRLLSSTKMALSRTIAFMGRGYNIDSLTGCTVPKLIFQDHMIVTFGNAHVLMIVKQLHKPFILTHKVIELR